MNLICETVFSVLSHFLQAVIKLKIFEILNMPPQCAMPIDEAVKVLKRYISFFIAETIPEWSSDVWKRMAEEPEIKNYGWKLHTIRTNVREDRRGLLTRTREECGYFITNRLKEEDDGNNSVIDDSDDDIRKDNENDKDYVPKFYEEELPELDSFDVVINRDLWKHIIIQVKKEDGYVNKKLRPKVWTQILACEFWKQFRLKCAFIFKKGEIHENGNYYATMHGKCKSIKCKSPIFGYINKDPGEERPIIVHFQCRDTRFLPHDDVHRPLQGEERKKVRTSVKEKGVKSTRIHEANNLLQPGDTGCPLLFSSNVLYQLKRESVNKEFNVKPEDRRNLIKAIMNMEDDPIYRDCIIHLGDTPFSVFYSSSSQLHCYKEYRRILKQNSSICIDATGGVVRKFMDSKNDKTSSIFLYQIVINFNNTTQPIYQMLSEIHDSDIISLWLSRWLRLNVSLPKKVVCDGSRALFNATCLSFNKYSLSHYIQLCFQYAQKNIIPKSIQTYIRLDTAHSMHSISKSKCWNLVLHKSVKSFYLYCFGLLIDSQDFKTIEFLSILIFIICNVEYEDSVIDYKYENEFLTPLKARQILENLIATKNTDDFINGLEERIDKIDTELDPEKQNGLNDNIEQSPEKILSWLIQIESHSFIIIEKGSKLNCFYVPNLSAQLKEKLKEFPLWTKVCFKYTNSRATSSYVEESFKDLKMILNKLISLPARVDVFMKAHLKILIGGVKLFQLKLSKYIEDTINFKIDDVNDESRNKDELNESYYENWRGFGEDPKHKKFNWIEPNHSSIIDDDSSRCSDVNASSNSNVLYPSFDKNIPNDKNLDDNKENDFDPPNMKDSSIITFSCNNSINEDHCYHLPSPRLVKTKTEKLDTAVTSKAVDKKHEGKYFKSLPDIKLINDGVTIKKRKTEKKDNNIKIRKNSKMARNLLLNGNGSGPIKTRDHTWFAYNTCPFDALVQMIYNGALEDLEFFNFLKNSKNDTFLFVVDFLSLGLTSETCGNIYSKRFEILHPIYKNSELNQMEIEDEESDFKSLSCTITCTDNVNVLWKKLFQDEPSVFEENICLSATCQDNKRNIPTLSVNHNTLINSGFQSLEESIIFQSVTENLYCQTCKEFNTISTRTLNRYIYIELDVPCKNTDESKKCKLRELPKQINLREKSLHGETKQRRYRLSGVVGYQSKHYIAYCQSLSGAWQFFNDCLRSPKGINSSIDIVAHGALYILAQDSTKT